MSATTAVLSILSYAGWFQHSKSMVVQSLIGREVCLIEKEQILSHSLG
jgi:hypothetical protein